MSGSTSPPLPAGQTESRKPKYTSQVRLSKGWLKTAAWGHDAIQLRKTISYPSQEDPSKFSYEDVLHWRIPAIDIPLVISELKKAEEFCKSKFAEAPAPPPLRQLVYEKIPASGEIRVADLKNLCVPTVCDEDGFVGALAELERLSLIKRRVEAAESLFPVVFVSRVAI